ncbi:MAG: exodeoxyribonuclease VII small subunit [Lentisphaerae bacterium RIFOXYC12_FULL_60_16]|nr:MAG: exodeoxyribonuclease VII small subunit [Lentisphaerae bacterium RIFOXYC12_FULL_60_16]OGV72461.1 MAG: exodeoxyribonuclease VII small subunit [Lentisphaerae bacterium RIFOXYA12_FULL_60_10]OGV86135.1 MAG: exodeoxyribonuclease VII small subunit [Lentisphaerae bacterium RIFOXYB12_FULL_60_10]
MTTDKQPVRSRKTEPRASFESSMSRLEKIVEEMEQGSLGLDDLIVRFEEGQRLLRTCTTRLNEIEKKVEMLVKRGNDWVEAPLDAGELTDDPETTPGPESGTEQPSRGELF